MVQTKSGAKKKRKYFAYLAGGEGCLLLEKVIGHVKPEAVFSLDDLTNLQSNHRLMTLYLRGMQEGLATIEDVLKYQDNIAAILRAGRADVELTDDVQKNAQVINETLITVEGG